MPFFAPAPIPAPEEDPSPASETRAFFAAGSIRAVNAFTLTLTATFSFAAGPVPGLGAGSGSSTVKSMSTASTADFLLGGIGELV